MHLTPGVGCGACAFMRGVGDGKKALTFPLLRSVSGRGVTIYVADDGVDISHPDLGGAGDGDSKFSCAASDDPVSPASFADTHGTNVAGIAAAQAGNSVCGVGVAPGGGLCSGPGSEGGLLLRPGTNARAIWPSRSYSVGGSSHRGHGKPIPRA